MIYRTRKKVAATIDETRTSNYVDAKKFNSFKKVWSMDYSEKVISIVSFQSV